MVWLACREAARRMEHRSAGRAVISVQVLQEYFAASTRKLGVDPGIAIEKLMLFAGVEIVDPFRG
jgi:predicted nucleic acid-binding protein